MHVCVSLGAALSPDLAQRHAAYRYRVFIQTLGWDMPTNGEIELDQFDRDDTLYVLAQDSDGDIVGTARLLPTTSPYLLAEVFPQLLGSQEAPRAAHVWELSRFAALSPAAARSQASEHLCSATAAGLLRAAMTAAQAVGATQLVTVSPVAVERLLRNLGIRSWRLAAPRVVAGERLVALGIDMQAGAGT